MSRFLTGHGPRAKLSLRVWQWCNTPVVHQHLGLTPLRGLQEDMVPLHTHPSARDSLKWGPLRSYRRFLKQFGVLAFQTFSVFFTFRGAKPQGWGQILRNMWQNASTRKTNTLPRPLGWKVMVGGAWCASRSGLGTKTVSYHQTLGMK